MPEVLLTVATTVLSTVALLVLKHIIKKIDRSNNRGRLLNYKIDTLVDCTSEQFGNGDFKIKFNNTLEGKMKEDNFIYKE